MNFYENTEQLNAVNERQWYIQKTQHTQQTNTRTTQNQDIETTCI